MPSFLQKLKKKGVVENSPDTTPKETINQQDVHEGVNQLSVDVYQSSREIVVYAQIAGVDQETLDVSLEGDNDVLTVRGVLKRPEEIASQHLHDAKNNKGKYAIEECFWGDFFRQIVLPEEVNPETAEAKIKDGALVLVLPFKGRDDKRIRMNVIRLDTEGEGH